MEEEAQAIYNVPSMQMTEGMLKYQLEIYEIVQEVQNKLLGRVPDFDTEQNKVIYREFPENRLINEKGMNYLLGEMSARLTKIFKLTYFHEDQAVAMQRGFGNVLRDSIFQHWDEWSIKSAADASSILNICIDPFIATTNAAVNGRFLAYLKATQQFQETQNISGSDGQYGDIATPLRNVPLIGRFMGKR